MRKNSSEQLYEDLKARITRGELAVGMAIPSENVLCGQYRISRPTVRRVLDKLCSRNLLEKRPGIGTFVKDPEQETKSYMYADFRIGTDHLADYSPHYSVLIINGFNDSPYGRNCYLKPLDSRKLEKGLLDVDVDALILRNYPDSVYEKLLRYKKPILVNNHRSALKEIASISVDDYLEAKRAVDYLIRYGYHDIACIGSVSSSKEGESSYWRMRGWEDAFLETGLKVPEHLKLPGASVLGYDMSAVSKFIASRKFNAAFFVNGSNFTRFVPCCNSAGGHDIHRLKLLVFDNIEPYHEYDTLACAYIKMPLERFGLLALEYLRRKAHDPAYSVMNAVLPCNMIVRY